MSEDRQSNPPAEQSDSDNSSSNEPSVLVRKRGRPKGSKNKIKASHLTPSERLFLEESQRVIQPSTGLTAAIAVHRAQVKAAAQGKVTAQRNFLDRLTRIEQKQIDADNAILEKLEQYVQIGEERLERASPQRRVELERILLPHPSDVEVDWARGTYQINGPATALERRRWRELKDSMSIQRDNILQLRRDIEEDPLNFRLQHAFDLLNSEYIDAWEKVPARHRPEPLPSWPNSHLFPWWNEPGAPAAVDPRQTHVSAASKARGNRARANLRKRIEQGA